MGNNYPAYLKSQMLRTLLYGGLHKNIYQEIAPLRNEENYESVRISSFFAAAAGIAFLVLISIGVIRKEAVTAYAKLSVLSLFVFLCTSFMKEGHRRFAAGLAYVFSIVLILYSIEIGSVHIGDPSRVSVTYHVFIVMIPFMIVDAPFGIIVLLTLSCIVFNLVNPLFKSTPAVMMDLVNSVFFTVLACTASILNGKRNMKRLANENYIFREHDTDALTGLLSGQALQTMIDTYISRRIQGEEGQMILIRLISEDKDPELVITARMRIAGDLRLMTNRYEYCGCADPDTFVVFYRECSGRDAEIKKTRLEDTIARSFLRAGIDMRIMTAAAGTRECSSFRELMKAAVQSLGKQTDNALPMESDQKSVPESSVSA